MGLGQRIQIVKRMIERGGVDAIWYAASNHDKSEYLVEDEEYKLVPHPTKLIYDYCVLKGRTTMIGATVDWSEPNTGIKPMSVKVKSQDGTITYIEGIDYKVDYDAGEIYRENTGNIPRNSYIKVTYRWYQPCINPETGNPRNDCPQCFGKGTVYDDGTVIRGLLHIPKYESPLTKIGFFELGDAIFTTTSLYKIKAKGYGDDHLFIRDLIVIDDGSGPQIWRVLAKPETIQLNNEFLAHKVHIRKISENEKLNNFAIGFIKKY